MARLAVFVDGGYVEGLRTRQFRRLRLRLDIQMLAEHLRQVVVEATPEPLDLFRTYYYTCPPFQPDPPTDDDRYRTAGYRRFVKALTQLPRFQVREGHLRQVDARENQRPTFVQKQVDLLLGLDAALLAGRQIVTHIAVVAGDGDFVPVLDVAKSEGVSVWLFHGPRATYAHDLWLAADERHEMDEAFMRDIARARDRDSRDSRSPGHNVPPCASLACALIPSAIPTRGAKPLPSSSWKSRPTRD